MALCLISAKLYKVGMTTLPFYDVDKQKTDQLLRSYCEIRIAVPQAICLIRNANWIAN